jgi:Na+/proline symporter
MWIQAIAIILPRIQRHFLRESSRLLRPERAFICMHIIACLRLHLYAVPDNRIGILSSTMFAGMMIGAVGWGTCEFFFLLLVNKA